MLQLFSAVGSGISPLTQLFSVVGSGINPTWAELWCVSV